MDEKPTEEFSDVGGLDTQIQELVRPSRGVSRVFAFVCDGSSSLFVCGPLFLLFTSPCLPPNPSRPHLGLLPEHFG